MEMFLSAFSDPPGRKQVVGLRMWLFFQREGKFQKNEMYLFR